MAAEVSGETRGEGLKWEGSLQQNRENVPSAGMGAVTYPRQLLQGPGIKNATALGIVIAR
jgi:hypothetical protein